MKYLGLPLYRSDHIAHLVRPQLISSGLLREDVSRQLLTDTAAASWAIEHQTMHSFTVATQLFVILTWCNRGFVYVRILQCAGCFRP